MLHLESHAHAGHHCYGLDILYNMHVSGYCNFTVESRIDQISDFNCVVTHADFRWFGVILFYCSIIIKVHFYSQSASEFEEEYERRAMEGQYDVIDTGVRLYDVMWVLAVALNRTMMAVESEDISGTGCEEVPGSLVPLEQFSYINEKMGCLIQWNLQRTNFSGVSVRNRWLKT